MFVRATLIFITVSCFREIESVRNSARTKSQTSALSNSNNCSSSSSSSAEGAGAAQPMQMMRVLFDPDDDAAADLKKRLEKVKQLPQTWNNIDELKTIAKTIGTLVTAQFCRTLEASDDFDKKHKRQPLVAHFQRDVCERTTLKKFVRYGRTPVLSERTLRALEIFIARAKLKPPPSDEDDECDVYQQFVMFGRGDVKDITRMKKMLLFGWNFLDVSQTFIANTRHAAQTDEHARALLATAGESARQLLATLQRAEVIVFRAAQLTIPAYLGEHQLHLGDAWKYAAMMLFLVAAICAIIEASDALLPLVAHDAAGVAALVDHALAAFALFMVKELFSALNIALKPPENPLAFYMI